MPFGTTVQERIIGQVGCSSVTMYDIQVIGPTGTSQSAVSKLSGTTDQYEVTMSWTPIASQYGPNLICAKAIDSTYLSSDNHCFTVLAGIIPPSLVSGTGSPSGLLSSSTLAGNITVITWSIQFTKTALRPIKSAYIYFYHINGTLLFQMDASVFTNIITYSGTTLTFETGNNFAAGSYYILFGYGVGLGSEYCQAESDAVKDSTFWTFSVSDTTTTTLSNAVAPTTLFGSTLPINGLSSTAAAILPFGVTTTKSTTAGVILTGFSTSSVTTTTITTTTTTTTVTTSTITTTTTVTTTTNVTSSITTTSNPLDECNLDNFIILYSCIWLGGMILHMASLSALFLLFLTS